MRWPHVLVLAIGLAACGGKTEGSSATGAGATKIEASSTIDAGATKIESIIEACKVPAEAVSGGQIILDSSMPSDLTVAGVNAALEKTYAVRAQADCVRSTFVSPAGKALLATASGISGPQSVTEDRLVYTQIYNKASHTEILTVQLTNWAFEARL